MGFNVSWVEVKGLEKDIILCVRSKDKSISEISKDLNKTCPNVSQSVSRITEEGIISRNHEYGKDARFAKVSLSKDRVKIKKTHHFYFICFFLSFLEIALAVIISFFTLSTGFLLGNLFGVLPLFFYMLYNAYVAEDKIIVEKNKKDEKKNSKKSS